MVQGSTSFQQLGVHALIPPQRLDATTQVYSSLLSSGLAGNGIPDAKVQGLKFIDLLRSYEMTSQSAQQLHNAHASLVEPGWIGQMYPQELAREPSELGGLLLSLSIGDQSTLVSIPHAKSRDFASASTSLSHLNDWIHEYDRQQYPPKISSIYGRDGMEAVINAPQQGKDQMVDAPGHLFQAARLRRGRKRLNEDHLTPKEKLRKEVARARSHQYFIANRDTPEYKAKQQRANLNYRTNPANRKRILEDKKRYRENRKNRQAEFSSKAPKTLTSQPPT